ncbi:MAG: peptidase C45 [SAR324 cluster bacterium]|nr:peptidase C45 [SAR324 cluster bacterium]MBL7035469.1 peptidase C45 [SAR324 cluster bacterium]
MSVEQLKTIEVAGTPKEIGFAIGKADADSIRQQLLTLTEFSALEQYWQGSSYLWRLDAAARSVFPEYVLELEGMALGAQVAYESLFLWNCRGDLPLNEGENPESVEHAPEGCTTLLLPAVDGRSAVIAHNEDGPPELNGHCYWLTVRQDNGTNYSTFHYPGMLPGHTFSVNSRGLVQTINNIRVSDLKTGIPRHFICRAILDSKTLDEALEFLQRQDRASGFHHSLGHSSGNELLSVEAPASGCAVKKIKSAATHANHLLNEVFCGLSQTVTESSAFRQNMSEKLISESVSTDPKSILFHQPSQGLSIFRRPNDGGDDYAFTLATGTFCISASGVKWQIHLDKNEIPALSN